MLFDDYAKILPVGKILPDIYSELLIKKIAVLKSPPGTGKTTLVPPMLLDAQWQKDKKILVIEPRRLAAKSAAYRVAELLGEQIGKTVGYRTRTETRVSSDTKIEFVTEGIFTHLLISNPELLNIGTVIFDEFHERHLESDLALSLVSDIRSALNPELRILIMSATLEAKKFSAVFENYGICECEGRLFPVEIKYLPGRYNQKLNEKMLLAISHALAESTGSILCFLPGMREIRNLYDSLREKFCNKKDILIFKLHGDLSSEEQTAAICPPPPGIRKIVLASSIAETSITIEGITAVIDSGLTRKSVFDPRTAISHLETVRISKASAEQRKGRAGRTAPGICIRIWNEHENALFADFDRPEILDADLSYLALVLAEWGITQVTELKWIDIPPPAKFAEAKRLLIELDALDESFKITPNGKKMLSLGLSPRLSAMIVKAKKLGLEALACEISAIITEKDI
ncbi:MAG: ATP-dependent helicase HrpB, partial [Candidatus Nanoarchaeia archaeon]